MATLGKLPALKMLNCKYVIYHPQAPPLTNPHRLGNAWIVDEFVVEQDAWDAVRKIGTNRSC